MERRIKNQNEKKATLESLYALLQKGEEDAQKRTEEFDRDLKKSREEFDRGMKESAEKFDREMKKSAEEFDRKMKKMREDDQKRSKEFSQSLKESEEKFNREMKEMREDDQKRSEEFDRKMDKMREEIGGIGHSNGDVAEEYFQNAFQDNPALNGQIYDKVSFNLHTKNKKKQIEGEFDLVMLNEESAAIIEIKYHLEKGNIEKVLKKALNRVKTFKALYPEYENHKLYLGIAALSFKENVENIIRQEGIAVIKQIGDKMVINSEHLKEF
ncbi:MAG: hypothetical protein FWG49_04040 [Leptospirales bacterium]|nr:hypothetical protein [Leptospirales bacterium]